MFEPAPFGQYVLVERLGKGGMAEVFLAIERHRYGVDRFVVIKRMLPQLCRSPKFVRLFLTEAKVIALLSHPNIVPVYEMGRCAGYYFIAMQYVPGVNLLELLSLARERDVHRQLPMGFGIGVACEVLRGLEYAHRRTAVDGSALNVVHRDVSPANVIVGFSGDVKLLDFGVAKSMLNLESASLITGKYQYMAPEVATGQAVDARADLFSLGLLLFELLVGEGPFGSHRPKEVLRKLITEPIPRPSELRPDIPPELDDIVLWTTRRNPSSRPSSASEMADALMDVAQRYGYDTAPAEREGVLHAIVPAERMRTPTVAPSVQMRAVVLAPSEQAAPLLDVLREAGFDSIHHSSLEGARSALRIDSGTHLVLASGHSGEALDLLCWAVSNHPTCHRLMIVDQPDSNVLMQAINDAKVDRVFVSPIDHRELSETLANILGRIRGDALSMEALDTEIDLLLSESDSVVEPSKEGDTETMQEGPVTSVDTLDRAATEVERALQLCDRVSVIAIEFAEQAVFTPPEHIEESLRDLTQSVLLEGDIAFWPNPGRLLVVRCERGVEDAEDTVARLHDALDRSLGTQGSLQLPWAAACVPDQYGTARDAVVGLYWQLASKV